MTCKTACDVIPAQAGTHATIVVQSETCVGARLRGHDVQ